MNTHTIQYDTVEEAQQAMAALNIAFSHSLYIARRNGKEITIMPPAVAGDMLNTLSFFQHLWQKVTKTINDNFALAYRQYH